MSKKQADAQIQLRGVQVHNLRGVDVDLPLHKLTVICGVSGSGKTSLAIDTLFVEGQRRFIESFSAYSRQFLARWPRPQADRLDRIPPAVLISPANDFSSSRRTLGAATEILDYLRLAFARFGIPFCPGCGVRVQRSTPDSVAHWCWRLASERRLMITFPRAVEASETWDEIRSGLMASGFVRAVIGPRIVHLPDFESRSMPSDTSIDMIHIVVDRVVTGEQVTKRIREACEVAFDYGDGRLALFVEGSVELRESATDLDQRQELKSQPTLAPAESAGQIDDLLWSRVDCDARLRCHRCTRELALPSPQLFNANSPLGACPVCNVRRSPTTDGRRGGRRTDSKEEAICPSCLGSRLREDALAYQVAGMNFYQMYQLPPGQLGKVWSTWRTAHPDLATAGHTIVQQITSRLHFLDTIGLDYLSLHRELHTLSSGERQRVALTTALGSNLVQLLYVLDEPTAGLHPVDVQRVRQALEALRDRGNTVVVVEHDEGILRAADYVIEVGPLAGESGGTITFAGRPKDIQRADASLTGAYLSGRRGRTSMSRRPPNRGWVKLLRASGHNLKKIDVAFPLGVLCVVTGVSGSGKTVLVDGTLYPALCKRKRKKSVPSLPYDEIVGDGQFDDVILVDQSAIGRTPRSNPVTFMKAFDDIRKIFAETMIARMSNRTPGHFSFNVDGGGRCTTCEGDGTLKIDMHFLPDIQINCPDCDGKRFRPEILEITYRGLNIADVLEMTVREAYAFFRGQRKVQTRLQHLLDVGLEYIRLGQPANTLSAGEAQRLKLASHLGATRRSRTVFLMDEPTRGLHFHDVVKLLDCFESLLSVGHSLIVVEHDLRLLSVADYIIELGPGAGVDGGNVIASGTPEQIAGSDLSPTAPFLRAALKERGEQP